MALERGGSPRYIHRLRFQKIQNQTYLDKGNIMPRVCKLTGKKIRSGNNVSHAHNVTKRTFKPNLQKKTLLINGKKVKVLVSTRALRSLTKGKTKNLNLDLQG